MDLQQCVDEWRDPSAASAVAAAVRVNGRLHWTSSSTDEGIVAADSQFPIYSITKTLTAICVLRLAETGGFRLTEPVTRWVPDVRLGDDIALAHLLRHTSGIGDYGSLPEYHEAVRSQPG